MSEESADELAAVREVARRVAERCPTDGEHAACWRRLRESGLHELRGPDYDGRPVASAGVAAAVVEELARSVCGAPLLGHLLGTDLARRAGLPLGEDTVAVVLTSDWSEAGSAGPAWDAAGAGGALACAGDKVRLVWLDAEIPTVDGSRSLRSVGAAESAPAADLPAGAAGDFASLARTLVAADLLGAADGILSTAVRYAGQREQFGAPIGSFQSVQHLLADAHVGLEALRSALLFAVRALDAEPISPESARRSLVAKSYANEAALHAVQTAVQVFGGIAITVEHPAHRHLRRVLVDRQVLGTSEYLDGRLLAEVAV